MKRIPGVGHLPKVLEDLESSKGPEVPERKENLHKENNSAEDIAVESDRRSHENEKKALLRIQEAKGFYFRHH